MAKNPKWILKDIAELPEEARAELVGELLAAIDEVPESEVESMGITQLSDFSEAGEKRYGKFGEMQGTSTGYAKLDAMMLGLIGGELIVVAGKTSRGKTTLALNIANNVALAGSSVLFVTLEMTHAEIASRYMYVNGGRNEAYEEVASRTVLQTRDEMDWKSIDRLMEKAKAEMDVDLVVIDHLHYFTRELENVSEDIGRITKEFKKNAIRHDVPVILISHVRKTGVKNEASMEDLRGSSYVAQDADVVLMVGRQEHDPNHIYIKIEKNRNRGYDPNHDTVALYVDKIKIYNADVDALFPEGQPGMEQPNPDRPKLF